MSNPFRIEGPAVVSFSGGRTSAMMLHHILDAHGGALPADVLVCFANTGKERPETLRFVHECETRWGVPVTWVEWRPTPALAAARASLAAWLTQNDPEGRMIDPAGFSRVGANSASRAGEPFAALIAMKQRLPNWNERWCTQFLKVVPLHAYAVSAGLVHGSYQEIIGLRNDEGHRILKGMDKARETGRSVVYPLARAKLTRFDVAAFWKTQPFDLGLQPHEGNCDFCFMKGKGIRKRIARDNPAVPVWWHGQEQGQDGSFDRRDTVADLIRNVRETPELFDPWDDEHDAECGDHCGVAE